MTNPLVYFTQILSTQDYLQKNKFDKLIDYSQYPSMVVSCDFESQTIEVYEQTIEIESVNTEIKKYSFEQCAKKQFGDALINARIIINETLLTQTFEIAENYLIRLYQELADLIKRFNHYHSSKKEFYFIKEGLISLLEEVCSKQINDKRKQVPIKSLSDSPQSQGDRLIWRGEIATLLTLFHELRTTHRTKEDIPYLQYDEKTIKEFLLNNFLDKNGDIIVTDTLNKYLDPKNTDKKAKRNRISFKE